MIFLSQCKDSRKFSGHGTPAYRIRDGDMILPLVSNTKSYRCTGRQQTDTKSSFPSAIRLLWFHPLVTFPRTGWPAGERQSIEIDTLIPTFCPDLTSTLSCAFPVRHNLSISAFLALISTFQMYICILYVPSNNPLTKFVTSTTQLVYVNAPEQRHYSGVAQSFNIHSWLSNPRGAAFFRTASSFVDPSTYPCHILADDH